MPLFQQLRRDLIKTSLHFNFLRSLSGTAAAQAAPALSRAFAEPLLYRDFIHQSLYHPVSAAVPMQQLTHSLLHGVLAGRPREQSSPLTSRCLRQQEFGYFNCASPPIRRLPEPINFNRLLNQAEYRYELAKAYKQLQV
jgi:hypothetical protein